MAYGKMYNGRSIDRGGELYRFSRLEHDDYDVGVGNKKRNQKVMARHLLRLPLLAPIL